MQLSVPSLAVYADEVAFDEFPREVVEQAKKLVLDSMGCAIGGFASPPSTILRSVYADYTPNDATILGTDTQLPLEYAGFINSTLVRYLDFNDCYTTGESACHPSDHIPALLSVAEVEEASGRDLIEAIVLAYEIHCRGVDTGSLWPRGFDYVTWGAHAFALAAGKLMGFDHDQLANALAVAGTANNSLLIARLGSVSMWKALAQPYAIHSAIQACQLARGGITGPETMFEGVVERDGEGGFFHAISDGPVSFEALGGQDDEYRILETSFKAYACGYFTHPSITAVMDLVTEHDLTPSEIESIDIATFDHAIQVYASGPEKWARDINRETADHSLPYNVSVAILDREVTPDQYDESHLRDDTVHELMAKITAQEDEELTAYRHENPRHVPARATIVANGTTYESRVDYPIGHPDRPMSHAQVEQKFEGLTDTLTTRQQQTVIDTVQHLEESSTVHDLIDSLVI